LGIGQTNTLPTWEENQVTELPKFNALDMLNLLADRNIINLKNIKQ
jgi:hypothetical protein